MVIANIFISSGLVKFLGRILKIPFRFIFNVNGSCSAAVLMGAISGFPVGAKCAVSLYEQKLCSKDEAEHLLAFCNNTGPAFLIGAVGSGLFNDYSLGIALYIIQLISALIVGAVLSFPRHKIIDTTNYGSVINLNISILSSSITNSVPSILSVCGYVCFFSVIINIFAYVIKSGLIFTFICGALEITSAVKNAASYPYYQGTLLAALFCGWSGLSVHTQVSSLVSSSGLSLRYYYVGKLAQSALSALLMLFYLSL